MDKLTRDDLYSLEKYAELRAQFRQQAINHKKNRLVALGEHVTLLFEDRLTVQYQVQEMLRIERIFEVSGIEEELAAYNPLIPDGSNWKATLMIEYTDVAERRAALAQLIGIEDKLWMQVGDSAKVYAIADEDMERANEEKTAAVHFLRFELTAAQAQAVQASEALTVGVDHPAYQHAVQVSEPVRAALAADIKVQ